MYMYRFILRFRCLDFVKCKVQLISTNGKMTRNYLTPHFANLKLESYLHVFLLLQSVS